MQDIVAKTCEIKKTLFGKWVYTDDTKLPGHRVDIVEDVYTSMGSFITKYMEERDGAIISVLRKSY